MSMTIYHNPRCSKSRQTLELIRAQGLTPIVVEYLQTPPDAATLIKLAELVGVPLADLLRRNEEDYRNAGEDVPLDDEQALAIWLQNHPKMLERPIVVSEEKGRAVVGRPPENVLELFSK